MKKVLYSLCLLDLQKFATIDDVIANHADNFGEDDLTKQNFDDLSKRLNDLGYDVLVNNREQAEFIPSSRLKEVVSQRETFKNQAETALKELKELKEKGELDDGTKDTIATLITQNETLLKELQETSIQLDIMSSAADAINPADVLPFINMKAIKLDKQGKPVSGVKEEVDRVRSEKPYLFSAQGANKGKGGFDPSESGSGQGSKADMNAAIRRAAFGGSRNL